MGCDVTIGLLCGLCSQHICDAVLYVIGVASYGALGHVPPPRLPASYFGDHSQKF